MPKAAKNPAAKQLAKRIRKATRLVPDHDPELAIHCSWEVKALMSEVRHTDLTPIELMAITIILAGANARRLGTVLSGPGTTVPEPTRPVLRAV